MRARLTPIVLSRPRVNTMITQVKGNTESKPVKRRLCDYLSVVVAHRWSLTECVDLQQISSRFKPCVAVDTEN